MLAPPHRPEVPFDVLEEARAQWRDGHTIEWIEWKALDYPGPRRGEMGWMIRLIPKDKRRTHWDIFIPDKPDDSPAVPVECEVC